MHRITRKILTDIRATMTILCGRKFPDNKYCSTSIVPKPNIPDFEFKNEPTLTYLKDSKEMKELHETIKKMSCTVEDIPIVINGKEYRTDECRVQVMPHNHQHALANFYHADEKLIHKAIASAVRSQKVWDQTSLAERLQIWEKAATLMTTKYRQTLNAATMLGQGKTVIQAEIDATVELTDFMRMNAYSLKEISKYCPISVDPKITKNSFRHRGLGGFVAAITPFNFTAISGNLAYTPALMGNCVIWKPTDTAILSNWIIYKIMLEAGLPPNVVQFVPADGPCFGNMITEMPCLSGINFTGSTATFKRLWRQVGDNIDYYHHFPRLVGECGGKNFHFVHPSADIENVVNCTIRSSFEYSGQKCSACSRMFVPQSLWSEMKCRLQKELSKLQVGDVTNVKTFMSAVIDKNAFQRITSYIDYAKCDCDKFQIIGGGEYCDKTGYFIEPTIIETQDPTDKLMTKEIFGPILTVFVYDDCDVKETIKLIKSSTQFGLTGAVFAEDKEFLKQALEAFKMSVGNFYINDKSTGAVVGQQPFGGALMSGKFN